MVKKRSSLLDIEASKKYISSASRKDKDNYHLSQSLSSKALLATPTLLVSKEVLNNLILLVSITSFKRNLIKLRLTNVNDILILTSIQDSLDQNQIILQNKIQNWLSKFLETWCLANIGASVTYINSQLLSHILLVWVKEIESKEIEFGNSTINKSNQKVDFCSSLGPIKKSFRPMQWQFQNTILI